MNDTDIDELICTMCRKNMRPTLKRILVLREKYRERYFDVSTPEQQKAVFLDIVIGRFRRNSNHWHNEEPEKPQPPVPGLPQQAFDALPAYSPIVLTAVAAITQYGRDMRFYEQAKKQYDAVIKCIDPATDRSEAARLATQIMGDRLRHEYEGWYIVEIEEQY